MKYLMFIDGSDFRQVDSFGEEDYAAVRDGYLEIFRLENGQFERAEVDDDGVLSWSVI